MKKIFLLLSILPMLNSCQVIYHGSMNQFYFKKKDFSWQQSQTKDFIVYYQQGSKAEKNLPLVEKKIKQGIDKARKFTKIDSIKTPIYYFIVDDPEEFNKLTRLNHTGLSYSKSNTIIESYFLLGEAHEVTHLIAFQKWGNTRTWISEGVSVYSDNTWGGKSLEKICFELYQNKKTIPVQNIVKKSKFHSFDSQIIYPQSGSLIKYLILTYGWDTFLRFWKKPNLKKIYNITEKELESDWINYLKKSN